MSTLQEYAMDIQGFMDAEGFTLTRMDEDCMLSPYWSLDWNQNGKPKHQSFDTVEAAVKFACNMVYPDAP